MSRTSQHDEHYEHCQTGDNNIQGLMCLCVYVFMYPCGCEEAVGPAAGLQVVSLVLGRDQAVLLPASLLRVTLRW